MRPVFSRLSSPSLRRWWMERAWVGGGYPLTTQFTLKRNRSEALGLPLRRRNRTCTCCLCNQSKVGASVRVNGCARKGAAAVQVRASVIFFFF